MAGNKNMLTVLAARNGWTLRTRSGVYVCTTIDQLVKEVKAYALVMQKDAATEQPNQED